MDPTVNVQLSLQDALAADIFAIPILRSAILSFLEPKDLATATCLNSELLVDVAKWLYLAADAEAFQHLIQNFCDGKRWDIYRSSVKTLKYRKTGPSLLWWSARLEGSRIASWYPNLQRVELGTASSRIDQGDQEAWLTLVTSDLGSVNRWTVEECRLSSPGSAVLMNASDDRPSSWVWRTKRLFVGPEYLPIHDGDTTVNDSEPSGADLEILEALDLTEVEEVRLSGFCVDGDPLLRILKKTPHLQQLEFYGGAEDTSLPAFPGLIDPTNGLLAARITQRCPSLTELIWHQCTEHQSEALVLGCVQSGLEGLSTLCCPWYDLRMSDGSERSRMTTARWISTFLSTGVPWQPAHCHLRKVRLEMHPNDARLSSPLDLAISLLLDFDATCEVELGFRPARHHAGQKDVLRDNGVLRALSNLEARNLGLMKAALEERQVLIRAMYHEPGYTLLE